MQSVAKLAGVSTTTVSQVMRGTGRISATTREKVLQAARDLRYVPDGRAAAMRSGENREIGFVINQISNPFNAEVISGVSDLLEADGYLVSVLDARDDPTRQRSHVEAFIKNGRCGLLWVPEAEAAAELLELLATQNIPAVTFLRQPENAHVDHVGIRNADATRTATGHLADLGHRSIVYLGGAQMTDVRRDRIRGYQDVLRERDLARPIIWDSDDTKMAGMQATFDLLDAHPETTAIVCNGDVVALGACLALARRGLTVGRDVSVVGFDDIPDAAVATPALTTMAVSPYQLGRRLAQVMLGRLREPEMPPTAHEIAAKLVVRETTGQCLS